MNKRIEKFNPADEYEKEPADDYIDWDRLEAEWEEIPIEVRMAEAGMYPVKTKSK